jgi:hypothetical protein
MSSEQAARLRTACVFAAGVALGCAAALAATRARSAPPSRRAPAAPPPGAAAPPPPPPPPPPPLHAHAGPLSLDDEITAEQLTRNVQFFGREGQQRISDALVVVIGLGVRACCTAP